MSESQLTMKLLAVVLLVGLGGASLWWLSEPDWDISSDSSLPLENSLALTAAQADWQQFLEANFAGDDSCADCHQEQSLAHQRSGHSRTATAMSEASIAEELTSIPYQDPRRDQQFQFQQTPSGFDVQTNDAGQTVDFPVHWLLGSGTHARTPVSIDPVSGFGVEFRWTWLASSQSLVVTPDHERFDDYRQHSLECFGRPMDPTQARACVGCHMTAVPPENVTPTPNMFVANVGCERCHGPRKKHAELARQGRGDEVPPAFTYDDPEMYLKRCAQCHRDEFNIPSDSEPNALARYQPYGIQQSKCYLNSATKMTCSTCHDPHDRVSTDSEAYNQTCLNCHATSERSNCSLQPAGDCVQCHMPAVEWHSGVSFHDHWIRVPQQRTIDDETSRNESAVPTGQAEGMP